LRTTSWGGEMPPDFAATGAAGAGAGTATAVTAASSLRLVAPLSPLAPTPTELSPATPTGASSVSGPLQVPPGGVGTTPLRSPLPRGSPLLCAGYVMTPPPGRSPTPRSATPPFPFGALLGTGPGSAGSAGSSNNCGTGPGGAGSASGLLPPSPTPSAGGPGSARAPPPTPARLIVAQRGDLVAPRATPPGGFTRGERPPVGAASHSAGALLAVEELQSPDTSFSSSQDLGALASPYVGPAPPAAGAPPPPRTTASGPGPLPPPASCLFLDDPAAAAALPPPQPSSLRAIRRSSTPSAATASVWDGLRLEGSGREAGAVTEAAPPPPTMRRFVLDDERLSDATASAETVAAVGRTGEEGDDACMCMPAPKATDAPAGLHWPVPAGPSADPSPKVGTAPADGEPTPARAVRFAATAVSTPSMAPTPASAVSHSSATSSLGTLGATATPPVHPVSTTETDPFGEPTFSLDDPTADDWLAGRPVTATTQPLRRTRPAPIAVGVAPAGGAAPARGALAARKKQRGEPSTRTPATVPLSRWGARSSDQNGSTMEIEEAGGEGEDAASGGTARMGVLVQVGALGGRMEEASKELNVCVAPAHPLPPPFSRVLALLNPAAPLVFVLLSVCQNCSPNRATKSQGTRTVTV